MEEATPLLVRRGRPRSESAEAAILEGAYQLMAEGGLASASIEAIARVSKSSKMTIYKWWPTREALLIDAFLRQAALTLPLPETGEPLAVLRAHAVAYADALSTPFGRVQLAVVCECIASTGTAREFSERYLKRRRDIALRVIAAGQQDGSILSSAPAGELYDRVYGTLFYQSVFGLRKVTGAVARKLVDQVMRPP